MTSNKPTRDAVDFVFSNHGSLFLVEATTIEARTHLRTHVQHDAQWFGNRLVVEPRYMVNLANNLMNDRFSVEGD